MKKMCGFIQSASAFGVLAGFIMTILSTAGIWVLIGSAVAGTAAMVTEMGIEQGAIAYQFNLPTFTFWQMYSITCALLLVLKPVIKINCHGKKTTN